MDNEQPLPVRAGTALALDLSVCSAADHTIRLRKTKHHKKPLTPPLKHGQGYCEISATNLFSEHYTTTDISAHSDVATPLVFGFSAASLRRKVILDSGATCSVGAVDQLAHEQHQFWRRGISLNAQSAKPLNFTVKQR